MEQTLTLREALEKEKNLYDEYLVGESVHQCMHRDSEDDCYDSFQYKDPKTEKEGTLTIPNVTGNSMKISWSFEGATSLEDTPSWFKTLVNNVLAIWEKGKNGELKEYIISYPELEAKESDYDDDLPI